MTTLFPNDAPPGLTEALRRLEERAAEERQTEGTRSNRRQPRNGNGVMWELAKIIVPAVLAAGSAYISVNTQIAELKGEVRALSDSMHKVETMLGIGVYKER